MQSLNRRADRLLGPALLLLLASLLQGCGGGGGSLNLPVTSGNTAPTGNTTAGAATGGTTAGGTTAGGSGTGGTTGGAGGTTGGTTGTTGGTTGGTPPPPAAANGAVLFVTQVPVAQFQSVVAAFGAQQPTVEQTPRGGDLYIRYPDGTLRNLTAEAGYGLPAGAQDGDKAIAVRQPTVHWNGNKALFSMVVGAPGKQYEVKTFRWQLYEVSGLGKTQTAIITKVPCQPTAYNNIAPLYGSDGKIIYVSDRPRNGAAYLYPQRDEYESQPIDTGLWKLDTTACSFKLLEHAVSGVTYPSIDSFGRLIFTRWDHLLRDQQADADTFENNAYQNGSFNYDSEDATTVPAALSRTEYFPELRLKQYSMPPGPGFDNKSIAPDYPFADHNFNHFFPWMLSQDGSAEETLNHVGRHELGGSYSDGSYRADQQLQYIQPGRYNGASYFFGGSNGSFHLREDPTHPGRFYAVSAPEFSTATGGDLVRIDGAPDINPDRMKVELIGKKDDYGLFRNPLPMSDGSLLVVHTDTKVLEKNSGTTAAPVFNYAFRIRQVMPATGSTLALGGYLTAGINKCVQYWNPDQRVSWCGNLWELDPVEVRSRATPAMTTEGALPAPEQQMLTAQGVSEELLQNWLHAHSLALIVSRNVTTRDRADLQQPFNLAVAGSTTQTRGTTAGTLYNVSHLQLFQADQIRGYATGGKSPQQGGTPSAGRRPLAVPLHDAAAVAAMGAQLSGPTASVPLGQDGSMAAFVPAGRATTWQLIDASKSGWSQAIVRERNWLSFKPGERRVCTSCHGINTADQAGHAAPQNPPLALGSLLAAWKDVVRNHCPATGSTGSWSYSGVAFSTCDEGRQYKIQTCQGGNSCCAGLPQTQTQACP